MAVIDKRMVGQRELLLIGVARSRGLRSRIRWICKGVCVPGVRVWPEMLVLYIVAIFRTTVSSGLGHFQRIMMDLVRIIETARQIPQA